MTSDVTTCLVAIAVLVNAGHDTSDALESILDAIAIRMPQWDVRSRPLADRQDDSSHVFQWLLATVLGDTDLIAAIGPHPGTHHAISNRRFLPAQQRATFDQQIETERQYRSSPLRTSIGVWMEASSFVEDRASTCDLHWCNYRHEYVLEVPVPARAQGTSVTLHDCLSQEYQCSKLDRLDCIQCRVSVCL